ncbi:hypothetical protein ABEF95_000553 [Exophiala dermatitidis]
MVDYAKKTVVELQEILKAHNLPHTGKKAELVARLTEADKEAEVNEETKAPPAESTSAPPEQQPEPAAPEVSETAAATATTTTEPESAAPQEEATQTASADADNAAKSASYALNLPQSEVDAEMAKRKARAERFGTAASAANGDVGAAGTESADAEALKALERAKRFGTGQTAMGKLDEALPTEPERRARKRNRTDDNSTLDDPALIRSFSGRGRGRGGRFHGRGGRDNSRRRAGEKPAGVTKQTGTFTSEADRLAAEARKKRFASAT